jgi:hypothetical protein
MPDERRFLLGYGERLTARVNGPAGSPPPGPAYSFPEAVERLAPQVVELEAVLNALPRAACPDNEAVATLVLHPQSLAKSYHPKRLLDTYNLRQVGSRPIEVTPDRWTRQDSPTASPSTELYVAGDRADFTRFASDFVEQPLRVPEAIQRLEEVRSPRREDRLRNLDRADSTSSGLLVELVLHASSLDDYIINAFSSFAEEVGVDADVDRRLYAGGLCFLPAEGSVAQLVELSSFAFLRAARPLARLRSTPQIERSVAAPALRPSPLPDDPEVDPEIRVAVFDGGMPSIHQMGRWVRSIDPPGIGDPVVSLQKHGHDVTSALLFGSLVPGQPAPRPFAAVDHYRVLDADSDDDPFELYDALRRIQAVLGENRYDFVNFSIGPSVAIEDDDVHSWTAVLDEFLATGKTLAAVAIGNNGRPNADEAERRIQVPADCLNALSVGAADSKRDGWSRADYSALGPGRAPGFVKPEVLDFGGTETEAFVVLDSERSDQRLGQTMGTSFASPSALRRGVAVRAHFGDRVTAMGIKALLVHAADPTDLDRSEVGWGRLPDDLSAVMTCGDGEVRVIYQGLLTPAQYLRAQVPLPPEALQGNVQLTATFAYATATDPEDPGSYSRAGLDITFRPHDQRFETPEAVDPSPRSFFRRSAYDTEGVLRRDAQQWETVLHRSEGLRGSSLRNPVFDVHYNARENGGQPSSPRPVPYALVVAVRSPRTPDLYDRVVRAFAGRLEALTPLIELPIRL